METLLAALRAGAEPTRLRLLALAGIGAFCVTELVEILGQSQPRLSRHLKLMADAGLLERMQEGPNAWFALPDGARGRLARDVIAHLPPDDPILGADRRQAVRVFAERARAASEDFRRKGAEWDEATALGLPADRIETAMLGLLPDRLGRALDIGTGTGRLLELLAPRIDSGVGVDASRHMLALARSRLGREGLSHCTVRQADMYRLPLPDASCDAAFLQMVLHYAEDPAGAVAEAARVLRPGGLLVVIDLLATVPPETVARFAFRWPGIGDDQIAAWISAAGLTPGRRLVVPGAHRVLLAPSTRPTNTTAPVPMTARRRAEAVA